MAGVSCIPNFVCSGAVQSGSFSGNRQNLEECVMGNGASGARRCVVGALMFASSLSLFGQATGSISGSLTDATGSAVRGATIKITAPATGFTRSTASGEKGDYVIPLLSAASYNVEVDASGFQKTEAKDIRLQVDEHRELDFKLSPATVQTSVEVTASTVAVQTTDATLGKSSPRSRSPICPKRPRFRAARNPHTRRGSGDQSQQLL